MVENLDYEMLNTIMKATAEMLKYNATLETAQKTLYAAFFTAGASIFSAGLRAGPEERLWPRSPAPENNRTPDRRPRKEA